MKINKKQRINELKTLRMEIVIKRQGAYVKKSQNSKLKYNCQNIGGLSKGLKNNAFSKTIKKRIMTLGQGSR